MFDIHVDDEGVVKLSGRLDAAQSPKASDVLRALDRAVTVDFSDLDYISSSGIAALVETFQRLRRSGHPFRLVRLKPRVRNIFTFSGLDQLLDIE